MSFVSAVINSQMLVMTFTTSGSMKCLRMGAAFSFIELSRPRQRASASTFSLLPQKSFHFIKHSRWERKFMIAFTKSLHQDTEYPEPFWTCVVLMEKYADVAYNAGTPASAIHLAAVDSEHSSSILGGAYPLVSPPHTFQPMMRNRKPHV